MAGYLTYFYILWEGGSTGKIIFINKLNKGLEKMDEMKMIFLSPPYLSSPVYHGISNHPFWAKSCTQG